MCNHNFLCTSLKATFTNLRVKSKKESNYRLNNLPVDSFKVTVASVMATSFQVQGFMDVSFQHPVLRIQILSTGFPAQYLLLHNRSVWGEVQGNELDVVGETVAFQTFERDLVFIERWRVV